MFNLTKWFLGVLSIVAIIAIVMFGSGCGYDPPSVVEQGQDGEIVVTDDPVREATPEDIAGVVVGVAAEVQPVIDGGDVTPESVERVGVTLAPILNPLTAGWWSAGLALSLAVWRQVEAGKRKTIIQEIDDNPDTPKAAAQVSVNNRRKVQKLAGW